MHIRPLIAAVAAAALAAAPVASAAQTGRAAEVAPQKESVEGNELRGGFLLPLAVIIAIIIAIILLTKDDDEGSISP